MKEIQPRELSMIHQPFPPDQQNLENERNHTASLAMTWLTMIC
jgi:hypothetical protein